MFLSIPLAAVVTVQLFCLVHIYSHVFSNPSSCRSGTSRPVRWQQPWASAAVCSRLQKGQDSWRPTSKALLQANGALRDQRLVEVAGVPHIEGTRWSRCHGDSQSVCQCAKRGMEASHIYWLGKPSAATKTYHHTSWDTFVALVLSRGDDAKLLSLPLPLELQSAGSRPPTESTYDVQSSDLLSKLDVQNTYLFSDGNRAWAKCAQEAGIEWSQVKHSVNHRTMTHKGPKPPLQEPPVLGRKTLQHRAGQLASENQLVMVTVPWKAQLAPPEAAGIDFVHPIQIGSHHPHLKQNIARSQRRWLQFARTFAKNGRKSHCWNASDRQNVGPFW